MPIDASPPAPREIVQDGQVVVFHYAMSDADGRALESTRGKAPVAVLYGRGNVPRGLEQALAGRAPGDRFTVTVLPADGFGERKGGGPQAVPRREFPKHV